MKDLQITIAGSQGAGKTRMADKIATLLFVEGFDVRVYDDNYDPMTTLYRDGDRPTATIRTEQSS